MTVEIVEVKGEVNVSGSLDVRVLLASDEDDSEFTVFVPVSERVMVSDVGDWDELLPVRVSVVDRVALEMVPDDSVAETDEDKGCDTEEELDWVLLVSEILLDPLLELIDVNEVESDVCEVLKSP